MLNFDPYQGDVCQP